MRVVVQDANILIDLIGCGAFSDFLSLKFETHTTSPVIAEIGRPEQLEWCEREIKRKRLTVHAVSTAEYLSLQSQWKMGLSVADLSVVKLAEAKQGILLSGDGAVRRAALRQGIPIHGMLWVFDQIVQNEILSPGEAAGKLKRLGELNPRLPEAEIVKRIRRWK